MALLRPGTALFAAASLAILAACWRPAQPAPRFHDAANTLGQSSQASYTAYFIPRPEGIREVHSAALTYLSNGDRLAVWFGGSIECGKDVVLYQARFRSGEWEMPSVLVAPQDVGRAEQRFVSRVGNTSLHRDARGHVHLFFVSVAIGGWSGSGINHMMSTDEGVNWSKPRRLITSPFFNLSTLVRHPAVNLADGGFMLPLYFELTNKFPEALYFDPDGVFVRKARMDPEHGSLQPCVVPIDDRHAMAFLRNRCQFDQKLLVQTTEDGGQTWSRPAPLALVNIDSPAAAARLPDGTWLLAHNPTRKRDIIKLAVSKDGVNWTDIASLDQKSAEREDGYDEYSYPTMLVEGDTVDLIYSYRRTGLRHVRFTSEWVRERRP